MSAEGHDPFQDEEELGKAYDSRLLTRLWPYVRPYSRQMLFTLFLVFPLTAFELAPGWIIATGIDSVFTGGSASEGVFLGSWLDAPGAFPPLLWLAVLYMAAVVGLAGMQFLNLYVMAWTGQHAMRDLRRDVFDHMQGLHLGFFDKYPVGRLVTRATNDVENLNEMFASGLVTLITDVVKMAIIATVLFVIHPKLALYTFLVVPPLVLCAVVFRLKVREAFRATRILIARINTMIQETITGMKVVQLFTRERRNFDAFDAMNAAHRDAWQRSIRWEAALFAVVEIVQNLTFAIILGVGAGVASVGTMYRFFDYLRRFFMPLRDLSAKYSVMQSSMASAERIFQLMDTAPGVDDLVSEPVVGDPADKGLVEFDGVWFAYRDEDWILQDVSFRVAPGEKVALVGHTGAGKTSIIKLLTRLYEPQRGSIRIDGVDLRDLPQAEARRRVAMVLQDVFLFSGSVGENIGLGRDDLSAADLELAARSVEAHRFIERLPGEYGAELRERGTNLSAGQRQLLSFARAVAHGAHILVLDEATSSIDTETEAAIQRGIHTLMEGKTAIAIAHRLSTIQDVDQIYVLHKGRIVEHGRHQELLDERGVYHRLYQLQYRAQEPQRPPRQRSDGLETGEAGSR